MALKPEQFTEQAQEVLHNSEEMVRRYNHSQWDVEHILAALLELERGTPEDILIELGVEANTVKARLHQMLEAAPKVTNQNNQIYSTPRASQLLENAKEEADRLKLVSNHWGQRITGMTARQKTLPVCPSKYKFTRHANNDRGVWISELLPHTATVAKELCVVHSTFTEAINHDPAITYIQTGSQIPGRPSLGAWLSYGLGSMNENLPGYVVMHARTSFAEQSLFSRLWGTGFLPSDHQGILLRSQGDPVLYLSNPPGVDNHTRRGFLDDLKILNEQKEEEFGDPETSTRIAQYEMAYRMQSSVPELTDLSDEPESMFELYGEDSRKPGTFARNCLLARRLAERDVRFIQLFHRGWDHHTRLPRSIQLQAKDVDQAQAALVTDLKQRGMLDETLVLWGGEFGRGPYSQGVLTDDNYGRDHHPRCFTIWMAGGGIRPGTTFGQTDDFSYNILENPVHIHDLHATMLHLLGIDHTKLTYRFQGRDFRLTDVHGSVVENILA